MPEKPTDFFGHNRAELEPLGQATLADLNREPFLVCRDARLRVIQGEVTSVFGLAKQFVGVMP